MLSRDVQRRHAFRSRIRLRAFYHVPKNSIERIFIGGVNPIEA